MATIKIDRGFTQKIQQKGMIHPPNAEPPGSHRKPPAKKGVSIGLILGAVGGVVALLAVGAVVLFGGRNKRPPATPAANRVPLPAVPVQAVAPVAQKQPEPSVDLPPDPEAELYAKHTGSSAPQPAQAPQPQPGGAPSNGPVWREAPVGGAEGLRCDYFERIPGKQISAIHKAANYPDRPDRTVQVRRFELSEDVGDNYGVRIRGFLVPSASGAYTFSVVADDAAQLWLSTDDTPANARRLVSYETWVPKGLWTARGDQQSPACELVAGRRYFIEAFLKENNGHDYLAVAWKGPVSDKYAVINSAFLQPWTEGTGAQTASVSVANSDQTRKAALASARRAVAEQVAKNASAYRYTAAADALKEGKASWQDAEARTLIETAILRFELLSRVRAFVQESLAKAPVRNVWTAFGGNADVTSASDEGIVVAPGRIVEWAKIPPGQMLRLINAIVPQVVAEPNTKSVLFLAAAVYCVEVEGGLELALKYRERALALQGSLAALADRVLGGTLEDLQAQIRMKDARVELGRAAVTAAQLSEKIAVRRDELAKVTGLVPGVLVEYWLRNPYGNLNEVRNKGLLKENPDATQVLEQFESPQNYAERFVARFRGYLTPPETGSYYFYIAADDQGELWLSEDETPEKLALVVKTDNYTSPRAWDRDKRRSAPVQLKKGQQYFFEGFLREGEKQDHFSVAWSPEAVDKPEIVTSANLLYAATAGFTPRAQELRNQIDADIQKGAALLSAVQALSAEDRARMEAGERSTAAEADVFMGQLDRAKGALREADALLKKIDAAIEQLRAASRPDASRT